MTTKTIRIELEDLPKGKVNLKQLTEAIKTDRVIYQPSEGITRRTAVLEDGTTSLVEEVVPPFMEVTFDGKEITAAEVVAAVKSHAPLKSTEEESAESRETLEIDEIVKKLKKSAFMKKVLARLKALDGKDE